ncbi:Mitogen-activated protein kinase 11 [Tilletia horrida]|nr:Mitogen-activated protein kinase 11 [Tilletia horrida]
MLREIKALRTVNNRHVVLLQSVLYNKQSVGIVLDLAQCDLRAVIKSFRPGAMAIPTCKLYLRQLLDGLRYLHDTVGLVHLDIKPENLLLEADHPSSATDCRLRPSSYSVDIFAAGVVLAEMMGPVPWVDKYFDPWMCFDEMLEFLGCPHGELWPGADKLPGLWQGQEGLGDLPIHLAKKGRIRFPPRSRAMQKLPCKVTGDGTEDLIALRNKILVLDPELRPRAREVLKEPRLNNDPKPATYGDLAPLQEKSLSTR